MPTLSKCALCILRDISALLDPSCRAHQEVSLPKRLSLSVEAIERDCGDGERSSWKGGVRRSRPEILA